MREVTGSNPVSPIKRPACVVLWFTARNQRPDPGYRGALPVGALVTFAAQTTVELRCFLLARTKAPRRSARTGTRLVGEDCRTNPYSSLHSGVGRIIDGVVGVRR